MINLLDGNVSSSNNVAYLNSLIDEMTYIDDTPFNFLNTTPTVFLNGYSAPTYETITGPKADSAFH
ncbi:hypothetical protein FACS1894166_08830 [Bacilli bacterium]|nr:hypothetical protein FACS1894166_08830 [Bacilli bacterium]